MIIVDEVSMISLETLHEMNLYLQTIKNDYNQPFGGFHILFCGDFYQLPPSDHGTPIYKPPNNNTAKAGREAWESLNEFQELLHNIRMERDDPNEPPDFLATFCYDARTGSQSEQQLATLNAENICMTPEQASRRAHPKALWMASK